MLRLSSCLAVVVALAACGKRDDAAPPPPPPVVVDAAPVVVDAAPGAIDLHPLTAAAGLADDAACLIVRFPDGTVRQTDADRCALRLRPASTFKIANTLIGADVGLIDSPDTILHYDPARYPPSTISDPAWKHDQTVREALAVSAVPLYRLLAIEIGAERMQAHLDALGYGNRSMAGGLDSFWLTGGLAISAAEQVDFLARLVAGTLPVSAQAHAVVRDALPRETAGDATLHWKTGTGEIDGPLWVGWLVGWVDRPAGPTVFACWIQGRTPVDDVRAHRMAVCRGGLAALGLFPAAP